MHRRWLRKILTNEQTNECGSIAHLRSSFSLVTLRILLKFCNNEFVNTTSARRSLVLCLAARFFFNFLSRASLQFDFIISYFVLMPRARFWSCKFLFRLPFTLGGVRARGRNRARPYAQTKLLCWINPVSFSHNFIINTHRTHSNTI